MSSNSASNNTNDTFWPMTEFEDPIHSEPLSAFSDQDLSGYKPTNQHVHGNKNANERARRNCLNAHLRDLAHCIPALQNVRRPSKTLILERAVGFFDQVQRRLNELENENLLLNREIDELKNAIAAISPNDHVDSLPSPQHSDDYSQTYSADSFTPSSTCNLYATPSASSESNFSSPPRSRTPTPCVLQEHGDFFAESTNTSVGLFAKSDPVWCQMPIHVVLPDSRPIPFQQEIYFPTDEEALFNSMKMETIMSMEDMSLEGIL